MSIPVSVIIRTKGDAERAPLLPRAINSVLSQEGVTVQLIIVLNGTNYDPELLAWLQSNERLTCTVLDGPGLAKASEVGRSLVKTEFVSFLDDDDEYLPDALRTRAQYLLNHPEVDCVVTDGEYCINGNIRGAIANPKLCVEDLAGSVIDGQNWLASCGATYRTKTVGQRYFDNLVPSSREWTLLGFRIATDLKVELLPIRTYRLYFTPGSETKGGSERYMIGSIDVIKAIEQWNRERKRVPRIKRALARAYHQASSFYRVRGEFDKAWTMHWLSLKNGGWQYIPYAFLILARSKTRVSQIRQHFSSDG